MSIDVFGRQLERSGGSLRGPPGVGFRLTPDGNFDIERKRICNLGEPIQPNDAVDLNTLRLIIQKEVNRLSLKLKEISDAVEKHETILQTLSTVVQSLKNDSRRSVLPPTLRHRDTF